MKFKVGEKYKAEYPIYDEDGNELDRFYLYGTIVYANNKSFIVCDYGEGSNLEIVMTDCSGLSFEQCKEYFTDFDYKPREKKLNRFGYLLHESFVPLSQTTE